MGEVFPPTEGSAICGFMGDGDQRVDIRKVVVNKQLDRGQRANRLQR